MFDWLFRTKSKIFKPTLHIAFDSETKNKPVIVLLHGIAANSASWVPTINNLDTKKNRIVSIDLLGFGHSPSPKTASYSVDEHVQYIRRTLKKLKIKEPIKLVGHSMGSLVATHYCYRYPDEVKQAYLVSLPLYLPREASPSLISRIQTNIYLEAYRYIRRNKNFSIKHGQRIKKILRLDDVLEISEHNWVAFTRSLENIIEKQNTINEIAIADTQFKVIYGNLDEFLVADNLKLLGKFRHVEIIKVSGVDHNIKNKKFAAKIAEELSK